MKRINKILETARATIETEYNSIRHLKEQINEDFAYAVDALFRMKGRAVVTGIGKSANIAQKVVATLNSTGTPSIFMHAADAIHGDLGIIRKEDVVIALSKSGETPEIKVLVPLLKGRCEQLIAIVGNKESYLAKQADYVLDVTVEKEACPNNLAPTSSTTAQLVMGDALAISLLELRGFTPADFAKFHPGGALGKRMFLRVYDLAVNNQVPQVDAAENISDVIIEISSKRLGATAVLEDGKLIGIITDGDLRRELNREISNNKNILSENSETVMTINPKTTNPENLAVDALNLMEDNKITMLPVINKNHKPIGVLHLHDLIDAGII